MSINVADYPAAVWDGLSPRRVDRETDAAPEYEDYDQITAEVVATQTELDRVEAARLDQFNLNAVADNAGAVLAGTVVYLKAAGTFADADADGAAALRVGIGVLKTGGADSLPYDIALAGSRLTLTTAEWDAAGPTTGGLTIGLKYYLSDAAPGQLLETTPPASVGDTLLLVGIGLSATEMLVLMQDTGLQIA